MNHPVQSRMQGDVGKAGEKPALTRLAFLIPTKNYADSPATEFSPVVKVRYRQLI